jgi:hypothetical protein
MILLRPRVAHAPPRPLDYHPARRCLMALHLTLVLLIFASACGCAADDRAQRSEPSPAPASTRETAAATPPPATAPAARVVEAVRTRKEGRNRIRTFDLKPGDAFATERGGVIKLSAIRDGEIVLDRTRPGWKIPARPMKHAIGNWEYIRVVSVDEDAGSLRLELRTVTKKRPWEALSF